MITLGVGLIRIIVIILNLTVKIAGQSEFGNASQYGSTKAIRILYLFLFDLWTSYLARILFLQGCGSLFWEISSSIRIFNELQYNL